MTFGEKVVSFHRKLRFAGQLPKGISVLNPFTESPVALDNLTRFASKFLNDERSRHLILGINPGRFGAGVTGIPFTDTKRLVNECGIPYTGKPTHEMSSDFVYEMITAYGGIKKFYRDFYINSPCPLGLVQSTNNGRETNLNYYDAPALIDALEDFMVESLQGLMELGVKREVCFCLGTGRNARFLAKLNERHHFFEKMIPLEHPRYILQYKRRVKGDYIAKYVAAFAAVAHS